MQAFHFNAFQQVNKLIKENQKCSCKGKKAPLSNKNGSDEAATKQEGGFKASVSSEEGMSPTNTDKENVFTFSMWKIFRYSRLEVHIFSFKGDIAMIRDRCCYCFNQNSLYYHTILYWPIIYTKPYCTSKRPLLRHQTKWSWRSSRYTGGLWNMTKTNCFVKL